MTIEEAIKHSEEVANKCDMLAEQAEHHHKCAAEHRQLAEWLKDYKRLKEQDSILDKIKSEIQNLRNCSCSCSDGIIDDVEDILDEYKI